MKKLIAIAFLAIASSFAFASDLSLAHYNKPMKFDSTASKDATASKEAAPAPSALESGAAKVGSFLGSLMKGPANMGKAFVAGIDKGFSGDTTSKKAENKSSEPQPAAKSAQLESDQATVTTASAEQAAPSHPGAVFMGFLKHLQAAAPSAEKDSVALNTEK